jgi:hypothetical protein
MKQKLTDVNGKTFEVTLDQLKDMTIDLTPAVNGEKAKPNFKISVKDSQGNDLDVAAIADAVKSDPGKMPAAIDVTFESLIPDRIETMRYIILIQWRLMHSHG